MSWTHISEYEKNIGLVWVCDPHLGAIDDPVVTLPSGSCLERKCIGARNGLGQTERAELVSLTRLLELLSEGETWTDFGFCEEGHEFILLLLGPMLADDGVHQCVMYVTHYGNGGVDLGQLFYDYDGCGKWGLCTSMFCARFNTHKL